jgi:PIN domain nuclease of toxin-antitoxin system
VRPLLLDTHIWLWSLLDPARLVRSVSEALEARQAELWLSPISVWETLVLAEKGRLELDQPASVWVSTALERVPLNEAPVTFEVAAAVDAIVLPHRDPADRLLLATASVFGLILVTADQRLIGQHEVPTMANR